MPLVNPKEGAKEALQAALVTDEKTENVSADEKKESAPVDALEVTEEDLKEHRDQKIPYARFKEVIEEKQKLKLELGRLRSNYQDDLRRAIEDAETRLSSRLPREEESESGVTLDLDANDKAIAREIQAMKSKIDRLNLELEENRLNATLATLKAKYPHMDEMSVLGKKRAVPEADIEDLARSDHERVEKMAESIVESIIAKKKEAARKPAVKMADARDGLKKLYEDTKGKKFEERQSALARYLRANNALF